MRAFNTPTKVATTCCQGVLPLAMLSMKFRTKATHLKHDHEKNLANPNEHIRLSEGVVPPLRERPVGGNGFSEGLRLKQNEAKMQGV